MDLKLALESLGDLERKAEELGRLRAALPGELESAVGGAAAARQAIEVERVRLEELEKRHREREASIQDCEARREKLQGQTALVKTNQEYTTLLSEIDAATQEISRLEEEVLQLMEETETAQAQVKSVEEEQGRAAAGLDAQADQLRARIEQVAKDLERCEQDRSEIARELSPEVRSHYDRIHQGRGSGISRITGRACRACHRDVPYETINRIKAGELHQCGSCQRYLLPPDDSS